MSCRYQPWRDELRRLTTLRGLLELHKDPELYPDPVLPALSLPFPHRADGAGREASSLLRRKRRRARRRATTCRPGEGRRLR